jgi:hypothetical protein
MTTYCKKSGTRKIEYPVDLLGSPVAGGASGYGERVIYTGPEIRLCVYNSGCYRSQVVWRSGITESGDGSRKREGVG